MCCDFGRPGQGVSFSSCSKTCKTFMHSHVEDVSECYILIIHLDSTTYDMLTQYSGVPSCSATSTTNVLNSQNGTKTSTKWGEIQTSVLVNEWKERIDDMKSARATEPWHRIVQEVNKVGSPKTTKQCKDKIKTKKIL